MCKPLITISFLGQHCDEYHLQSHLGKEIPKVTRCISWLSHMFHSASSCKSSLASSSWPGSVIPAKRLAHFSPDNPWTQEVQGALSSHRSMGSLLHPPKKTKTFKHVEPRVLGNKKHNIPKGMGSHGKWGHPCFQSLLPECRYFSCWDCLWRIALHTWREFSPTWKFSCTFHGVIEYSIRLATSRECGMGYNQCTAVEWDPWLDALLYGIRHPPAPG